MSDCLHAAGRCLLSALFLWAALHFCANADAARAGLVAGAGYPSGGVGTALFWLAALLSAAGGLLIATNLRVGVGAAILGGLLVPATWFLDAVPLSVAVARGDADAAAAQFCSLLKNVAIVGAMCMVASYEARGSGTHQKTD